MTETHTSPAAATERVFDSLGKVIGLIAGALSIGYLIGWRYSAHYWSFYHAPWVLDLLSPTQMLADAGILITPMMFAALFSIVGVMSGVRDRTLRWWFKGLATCGVATTGAYFLPESILPGYVTREIYRLVPVCLMGAAGVAFGLLVSNFRQTNLKWDNIIANYVVWLFGAIIFQGPALWADGRAALDTHAATSTLEVVSWPDEPIGDWRLGRVVDKGFVVIKLTPDPRVTEVRLLPFSIEVLIRPVNQPIM
jgi:hypothetical protein